MASDEAQRRKSLKGARNPLREVRKGGERFFDLDPSNLLVYIKSRWTGEITIIDLKDYLPDESENLGG